jgi:uncharacterized protein
MNIFRRYQAAAYVAAALGWTWTIWGFLIISGLNCGSHLWKLIFVAGLSGPLIASTFMAYVIGGKAELVRLLKRALPMKVPIHWYILALGLPPAMLIASAVICKESLHENLRLFDSSLAALVPMFIWLMFRSGPVNEEFGWRGFLLPRLLEKHNPFAATMILGTLWTLWHWPLWFLRGVPHSHWPFALFALMVLPMNFLFTWFYMKTKGSLFIAILLHTSINAAIKFIPIFPPEIPSLAPFIIWVSLAWAFIAALVVWEKRAWFGHPSQPPPITFSSVNPTLPLGLK